MSGTWLVLALSFTPLHTGAAVSGSTARITGDAEPPRIVSIEPAHREMEVDAKKVTQLVVTFDQPMDDKSWSLCQAGGEFPPIKGKPHWDTPKKLVVDVELAPEKDYLLSLNCYGATGFHNQAGVPSVPFSWSFSTLPEKLPDQVKQKAENKKAWTALQSVMEESYSYQDRLVKDWKKLWQKNEAAVLNAKTTRSWAGTVARVLAVTEDIHLYLKVGSSTYGTGSRSVDPLFRKEMLKKYVLVQPAGELGLVGKTADGIGYVMISAWENPPAIDAIELALGGLRDCKAVVVDVRPNSGGGEDLAQNVAAWFVEGTKAYAKHRTRVRAGKNGFDSVVSRVMTGNKDPARRLDVPIAVLTSRYVMSSNESFVMMLQQAKDCTVVGQPTYGSSGCPKPHELPNGVTIVVPSWQDLRMDGTCLEGEGLAPDVLVECDAERLEKGDPILEKALALLREKVAVKR